MFLGVFAQVDGAETMLPIFSWNKVIVSLRSIKLTIVLVYMYAYMYSMFDVAVSELWSLMGSPSLRSSLMEILWHDREGRRSHTLPCPPIAGDVIVYLQTILLSYTPTCFK